MVEASAHIRPEPCRSSRAASRSLPAWLWMRAFSPAEGGRSDDSPLAISAVLHSSSVRSFGLRGPQSRGQSATEDDRSEIPPLRGPPRRRRPLEVARSGRPPPPHRAAALRRAGQPLPHQPGLAHTGRTSDDSTLNRAPPQSVTQPPHFGGSPHQPTAHAPRLTGGCTPVQNW